MIRVLNRVLRHNVCNDVNAILGWASVLSDGEVTPAEAGDRIEAVATELAALTDRARDLERFAGRDRDPERIGPEELVESVRAHHAEHWSSAELSVTVQTDRDLAAGREIERAICELVENAVTHHPAVDPEVSLSIRDAQQWIEIAVVDDGWGIERMEATVLESGRETDLQHGFGLGLWLVNWIVTRYGGTFEVEPREPAPGTTARLRLPAIEPGETVDDVERPPTVLFR